MLKVVDQRPEEPTHGGPYLTMAAGTLMAVSAMTGGGDTAFTMAALLLGGGWFWKYQQRGVYLHRKQSGDRYMARLQQALETIGSSAHRLPEVDSPIPLRRGEACLWVGEAEWYELRTRTTRVNYAGASLSIPIVKGVRYRVGSFTPQRVTREEIELIDVGSLVITTKRLFFNGAKRNTTIELRHLVGVGLDAATLILDKTSGRDPQLRVIGGDSPIDAGVILARLLAEQNAATV